MAGGKGRKSPKASKSGGKKSPKGSPALVKKQKQKEQYEEPIHSMRVVKKHRAIKVSVHLHKIPPKHIVFEPTPTHLVVHTLGHNKKLYLNKKFPDGITVHASKDSEAQLEYGILTAFLKIDEDPSGVLDPVERTSGSKRKRDDVRSSDLAKAEAPKKRRKLVQPEPEPEPKVESESESEAEAEEEEEESEDQEVEQESSGDDGEDDFEYGADYEDVEMDESDDGEKEEQVPKGKKKKKFLTKTSALDLIEQVNQKEDATRTKKLTSERAKREAIAQQETVKEQRQSEKAKKKELEKKRVEVELKQQKAQRKSEKREQKKAKPAPLTPIKETAAGSKDSPRSALRTPKSPALDKSRRVSFSQQVHVQPIPIVRSTTPLPDPMITALRVNIEERIKAELNLGEDDEVPDEMIDRYISMMYSQDKQRKGKGNKKKKGKKGKRQA